MKKLISFLLFAIFANTAQAVNLADGQTMFIVAHDDDQTLFFDPLQGLNKCTVVMSADGYSRSTNVLGPVYTDNAFARLSAQPAMSDTSFIVQTEAARGFRDNTIMEHGNLVNRVQTIWANRSATSQCAGTTRIVTHNPWGEYGHSNHIQVFNAVKAFGLANSVDIFFDGVVHAPGSDGDLGGLPYSTAQVNLPLEASYYGISSLFFSQRFDYHSTNVSYRAITTAPTPYFDPYNTNTALADSWTWGTYAGSTDDGEYPTSHVFLRATAGAYDYTINPTVATGISNVKEFIRNSSPNAVKHSSQLYFTHQNLYASLPYSSQGTKEFSELHQCYMTNQCLPVEWSLETEAIVQRFVNLYPAAFLRAPDAGGVRYWVSQVLAGQSVETTMGIIFSLDGVKAIYPTGMSSAAFVTAIYNNVFDRAPDSEGLLYWTNELNALIAANTLYKGRGMLTERMINAAVRTPYQTNGRQTALDRMMFADALFTSQLANHKDLATLTFASYPTRNYTATCTHTINGVPTTELCYDYEGASGSGQAASASSVLIPSLHRALQHVTNMSNSSE